MAVNDPTIEQAILDILKAVERIENRQIGMLTGATKWLKDIGYEFPEDKPNEDR